MWKPSASLNPTQSATPKSISRRTMFNFESCRVDDPSLTFKNNSSSSDLFVFGEDDPGETSKHNHTKPANTNSKICDNRIMLSEEIASPAKEMGACTPENEQCKMPNLNSPYNKPTPTQLRQYLNSPSAFLQIKARQAINNPEQFVADSDTDDEVETLRAQAPQPAAHLHEVLIGIVAYVEVHFNRNDHSDGGKYMLERLGATVRDSLLKDVTHVIFKGGRVSTYKKAKERKLHLLSVHWIEACRKCMYKACESLYPATGLEEYETMAFYNQRTRPLLPSGMPKKDKSKKTQKPAPSSVQRFNVTLEDSASNKNQFSNVKENDLSLSSPKPDLVDTLENVAELNLNLDDCDLTKKTEKSNIFQPLEPLATTLMRRFMAGKDIKTSDGEENKENENESPQSDENKISGLLSKISVSDSEDKYSSGVVNNSIIESPKIITNKDSTTSDSFRSLQLAFNPVTPVKKKRRISVKSPVRNGSSLSSSLNKDSTDSSIRLHLSSTSEESVTTFCSDNSISNKNETRSENRETEEILKEINTAVSNVISNRRRSIRIASKENLMSDSQCSQITFKSSQSRRKSIKNLGDKISTDNYLVEDENKKPNEVNITSNSTEKIPGASTTSDGTPDLSKHSLNRSKSTSSGIQFTSSGVQITPDLLKAYTRRRTLMEPQHNIPETDDTEDDLAKIDNSLPYFMSPIIKKPVETDPSTPKIIKKRKLYSMHVISEASMMKATLADENKPKPNTLDHYFLTSTTKPVAREVKQVKRVLNKNPKPCQTSIKPYFAESNSATSQILTDSLMRNLSAIAPARRSTLEFQKKPTKQELKEKAQKKVVGKRTTSIVCTSLHKEQIEQVKKAIKKLGGFVYCASVSPSTSHVVSLESRRTLSLLKGIARGCWILNLDWVIKSDEAGKWLEEDVFEWASFSPAVQRARIERQAFGDSFKMDIFSTSGSIYISKKCSPPWRDLQDLVTLCCGKIVSSYQLADVVVGEVFDKQLCVMPTWILDSITNYKAKSVNSYIIHEKL